MRLSQQFGCAHVGIVAATALACVGFSGLASAQTKKSFLDYLKPAPITCSPLSSETWGVDAVLPRDLCNGIESAKGAGVPPDYYYWDGQIIRANDGKYHMFMSTWAGANGFNPGWLNSDAYHAISEQGVLGPYTRQDYIYSNNGSHKGHNVSALELPDGSYAVIVSETVPFTIYTSNSLDGPWTSCTAQIQANGINYSDANFSSNVSLIPRHDGKFEIVQRHGHIGIADTLCGPYQLQKPTWTYPAENRPTLDSIYPRRTSIPGVSNPTYEWEEDPHIWRSGGTYHVLYSGSGDRVGYHLYSADGINDWTDNGLAFSPREYERIFGYEGSETIPQWYKMERPGVVLQDGHPTHITWAVSDVNKDNEIPGGSNHGSKIIVVPFDGVAFDTDFGDGTGATGGEGAGGGSNEGGGAGTAGADVGGDGGQGTAGQGTAGQGTAGTANSGGADVGGQGGAAAGTGAVGAGGEGAGGLSIGGGSFGGLGGLAGTPTAGGAPGSGGTPGSGGAQTVGGAPGRGGAPGSGGTGVGGGALGSGGAVTSGGTGVGGGALGSGGAFASGGAQAGTAATPGPAGAAADPDGSNATTADDDSGCSCKLGARTASPAPWSLVLALMVSVHRWRRRGKGKQPAQLA